jgi:Xaa-Pro aminopeptidase
MSVQKIPVLVRGRTIWDRVQFPPEEFLARAERVRGLMESHGLDGLLLYANALHNGPVSYLTNYQCFITWADALCIFPKSGPPVLMACLPPRDVARVKESIFDQVELESAGMNLVSNHHLGGKVVERLQQSNALGLRWGGVNLQAMPALAFDALGSALGPVADCSREFARLTAVKSAREISAIGQATLMAKRAAYELIRTCRPGVSEHEAVAAIERQARIAGNEDVTLLLAAGSEAQALHPASDRSFQTGDTLQVYAAVQYLHYWGAYGLTASVGAAGAATCELMRELEQAWAEVTEELQHSGKLGGSTLPAARLQPGTRLSAYSMVHGIGLDVREAPFAGREVQALEAETTLAVTLGLGKRGTPGVSATDVLLWRPGSAQFLGGPRPEGVPVTAG